MQDSGMNAARVTVSDSPTPANLFDEFEEAFQNCLAPLTKEDPLNGINQEELRVNAETNAQRFLELAHRMEASFLQKRFLLSVQKPESLLLEENHEMRLEIQRKDDLIKKQTEKLTEWQNTLMNLIARVGSVPPSSTRPLSMASAPSGHLIPSHTPVAGSGQGSGGQSPSMMGGMSQHISSSNNMGVMMHQPMMGQIAPGGSSMNQPYQHMGSMNNSGNQMHSTGMGGLPTSMTSIPGTQGSMPVGPGPMTSNLGPMMPVGASQGSSVFHGAPQGGLQGPLAYLEKTTTNIGMPESRR